ncbi:MAG: Fe-S cluster assembly protein SufD [Pontiellaceae bacterium]|nr:Fe-S cluster assembly protein SufD [Pontiellaceae bacterium]
MKISELRKKAAEAFAAKGFPTTKEELWRFTDVSSLANATFLGEWKPAEIACTPLSDIAVVFENGRLSSEKSSLDGLPSGVRIELITEVQDDRIGTLADIQQPLVAANTAEFSAGVYIEVADGVELKEPIHLIYLADVGGAFHLRNLIACGAGASFAVVEEYVGGPPEYWTNAVTEVLVEDGGAVDHYKLQREGTEAFHFQTIEARVGAAARFSNLAVAMGGKLGRNDIRSRLIGEGGEVVCNGLSLLKARQLFDTHLFMDHAVPKCNSHELYKGILDEQARSVFCGRILVQQDAQQTDAVQSNKSLLLSRSAKVNSLPQLEIYADDVKCTHGATVGQLDEQALYYLQTRGIDPLAGHAMLTFAFANEVLDDVQCKPVKTYFEKVVKEWLNGVAV